MMFVTICCVVSFEQISCLQRQIHTVHFKTRTASIKGAKDVFNERRLWPDFYKIKSVLLEINQPAVCMRHF